jgi:NOL1/NOP2/fmu family ribosome biogenesis protein
LSQGSSRNRRSYETVDESEIAELWRARFGLPDDAFSGYRFFRRAQSIWVLTDVKIPRLSFETLGLRMMSLKDRPWKPTTCALQIFGKYATKNIVRLNCEEAAKFLAGESQLLPCDCESGYVVVFYGGEVLGCGLYSHGKLISQLPKERRMARCEEGDECS